MKVSLPVAQAMAQPSQPLPSTDLALLRCAFAVAMCSWAYSPSPIPAPFGDGFFG